MGHKNRANFKFWSHKKIFPPGAHARNKHFMEIKNNSYLLMFMRLEFAGTIMATKLEN